MDIFNRPVSSAEREAQRKKYQEWNDRRLAEDRTASAMAANRLLDLKAAGQPITNKDRVDAQYGWERNMQMRQVRGSGIPYAVRPNSYKDMRADLGDTALYKRAFSDGRGRLPLSKQAAEGTVPSAEASMPAHEESHDTHGNEVNPFEKVVKAYNAYKAKKGFKEETPTVEPNVTGNLPPAPGNLVHEWYAKEHTGKAGMERMASVMEKQAISWNGAKHWLGKWWGNMGDLYDKVTEGKWEEVPDAMWNATPVAVGLEAAEKQSDDFIGRRIDAGIKKLQSPEVQKELDAQSSRAGRNMANGAMDAMWDRGKELWNEYGKGNQFGNVFGMGGENWKWLAGALGLGALGYGAYRMFSGGGGSGGGWGGGAANSSAYYRNRHGYNHPDYEGMMVDNMMARRGGYGY